jgi:large-conductance mechanosensitive channel
MRFPPLSSAFGKSLRWILSSLEILKIMDWIPVVFVTFKFLVLATGMFFAVKWHYDQGKKEQDKEREKRAVLRAGGKVAAVFVLSLLGLGLVTFLLIRMLGMDLSFP